MDNLEDFNAVYQQVHLSQNVSRICSKASFKFDLDQVGELIGVAEDETPRVWEIAKISCYWQDSEIESMLARIQNSGEPITWDLIETISRAGN